MAELPTKHPDVVKEFNHGKFTVQKTNGVFSAISIDQAHEQNNDYIKGYGGVSKTNSSNPSAAHRWMVAEPEDCKGSRGVSR